MKLITRILLSAVVLLVLAYYIPGIYVDGVYIAIVTAVVLGLLNAIARPILFVLTLPITLLTLGLFTFVINALLFWFAASFIDGFDVTSVTLSGGAEISAFWVALLGSVVMSIAASFSNKLID